MVFGFVFPRSLLIVKLKNTMPSPSARAARASADGGSVGANNVAPPAAVLQNLHCPITLFICRDPVVLSTGHTFERAALMDHFKSQEDEGLPTTCPITKLHVSADSVMFGGNLRDN